MIKMVKKGIKGTLRAAGIGTYNIRNCSRRFMDEVLDQLLRQGFYPKTVIDVGVAYGTFDLYKKFPKSQHLLVEPLQEYLPTLKTLAKKYGAKYELAAAGSAPGSIEINVHPDLSGSSIFKEAEGSRVDGVARKVNVVTLDDVCTRQELSGPYLLKVDTQGAELEVLGGAKRILSETEVIMLEVSLFRFYKNGPQFYDIVDWMKQRGFVVYDIYSGHNRPLDGALAQVDMVFVKENGLFRKSHHYANPKQREQHVKKIGSLDNPKK